MINKAERTCIYEIRNLVNGKFYIGSATYFAVRRSVHLNSLARGSHKNPHMQAAYNLYGKAAFEFKKLLICKKEDLLFFEQLCIDGLRPDYNIHKIAGSPRGYRHSEDTKERMRQAHREMSPEARSNIVNAKRAKWTQTPEARALISAANKGRRRTEELKVHLGRHNAHFTDEQVREMRRLKAEGATHTELANVYGKDPSNIRAIVSGKTYKWV